MTKGVDPASMEPPKPFRYHRFKSLRKDGWSAAGWYAGGSSGDLPKAPRGWRWLAYGELVAIGDLCCDPRGDPVVVVASNSRWRMTPTHHPVLRRRATTQETNDEAI
jgi:hypothetical protein